jgi:hypothetical protein
LKYYNYLFYYFQYIISVALHLIILYTLPFFLLSPQLRTYWFFIFYTFYHVHIIKYLLSAVNRRILYTLLSHITSKECDVETDIITISIFGGPEMPAIITTIRSAFLNPEIFKNPLRDHHKRSGTEKVEINFIVRYYRISHPIELN